MPAVGEHWIYNSLSIIALSTYYKIDIKKILNSLSFFKVPLGRGNNIFLKYKKSANKNFKILSPYNLTTDIVYRSVLMFNTISEKLSFKRKLLKNNIETIIPVENFELLHNYKKLNKKNFQVAENISKKTLSLPLHLSLKKNEINKICKLIKNFK